MTPPSGTKSIGKQLAAVFNRNGYVRLQNAARLGAEGYARYKKGDELRFVVKSRRELGAVRRLLRLAGFQPGRPFAKALQLAQPVYGRTAVRELLTLMGAAATAKRSAVRERSRAKRRGAAEARKRPVRHAKGAKAAARPRRRR